MYKDCFKRLFDFCVALVSLVLFSPIFVFLYFFLSSGGTAFFLQARPGKDLKIFKIIKFKTMNDNKDGNGDLLPDMERLTRFGRFIRKTSLDEIPQLINVLKGDMSLVGPRPLLVDYIPLYSEEQNKRHLVRPGITGWAQVNGRNSISWKQKFELDVDYVNKISFVLDIKILILTIKKAIKGEGVNQKVSTTMQAFKGN